MTTRRRRRRRPYDPPVSPGDDVVPVPAPVTQVPPPGRCCDLVLTGGIASGVVYPWAIVELARHYRFRNIGGTSVGAMAAALAAAAEYGRCTGARQPFEVLRRAPAALAEEDAHGRTRMRSLFQPNRHGQRLLELFVRFGRGNEAGTQTGVSATPEKTQPAPKPPWRRIGLLHGLSIVARVYWAPGLAGIVVAAVLCAPGLNPASDIRLLPALLIALVVLFTVPALGIGLALWHDVRKGLLDNDYGLCKGGTIAVRGNHGPGLVDWLHDSIQRAAGLERDDRPLTFGDLWNAPSDTGVPGGRCSAADPPACRSINLQMITTNLSFGRPMRLPLEDGTIRLFFRREELKRYFPRPVLDALVRVSRPYAPTGAAGAEPPSDDASAKGLLELPVEELPVVVAARLSLSYPILFSAVPLWAIDFEAPRGGRTLRRCLFTDGGVSSNFPIHLFDAAVPRWPTFGLWLDRRPPYLYPDKDGELVDEDVWLPEFVNQGRGDNWDRFDPHSRAINPTSAAPVRDRSYLRGRDEPDPRPGSSQAHLRLLTGFATALLESAKDWRDRTGFRLPHVRNRVARLMLRPGEGGLNIGMSRELILQMAHRYGTKAGQLFVERYMEQDGRPSRAWNEQRWVRFNLLVNGLRERLDGLAASASRSGDSVPLRGAIERAAVGSTKNEPIADHDNPQQIVPETKQALLAALSELERLEQVLQATPSAFASPPDPELRMRPPL